MCIKFVPVYSRPVIGGSWPIPISAFIGMGFSYSLRLVYINSMFVLRNRSCGALALTTVFICSCFFNHHRWGCLIDGGRRPHRSKLEHRPHPYHDYHPHSLHKSTEDGRRRNRQTLQWTKFGRSDSLQSLPVHASKKLATLFSQLPQQTSFPLAPVASARRSTALLVRYCIPLRVWAWQRNDGTWHVDENRK